MRLYLDIETVPAQRPDVLEETRATEQAALDAGLAAIKPPGNYKKQETIDEWLKTEAPKLTKELLAGFEDTVDAAYRKTSLDGSYGQICVIGWAFDDGGVYTALSPDNEAYVLNEFARIATNSIPPNERHNTTVIGHNVSAFDLRFLTQRYIVNGIKPPMCIARAAQAKPWESEKVFDLMVQWCGVGHKIKLEKLCRALSIESPKGELDGSKVWDYVKAGRIDEVARYCERDVEAARAVHKRMTFATVAAEQFEDVSA